MLWAHTRRIRSSDNTSRHDDIRRVKDYRGQNPGHTPGGGVNISALVQGLSLAEWAAKPSGIQRENRRSDSDQKPKVASKITSVFEERPSANFPPAPAQQSLAYDPASDRPAETLPADWIAHRDATTGNFYYIHLPTQAVQWEFPASGSMPSQSSLAPIYHYGSEYAGYYPQEYGASPSQPAEPVVIHDQPLDSDLEEAIKRSNTDFQRSKVPESPKSRGSKSKASKSSGKGSTNANEIGSETSSASKKVKDTNTSPLWTFLAGGKRR